MHEKGVWISETLKKQAIAAANSDFDFDYDSQLITFAPIDPHSRQVGLPPAHEWLGLQAQMINWTACPPTSLPIYPQTSPPELKERRWKPLTFSLSRRDAFRPQSHH